MEKLDIIRSYYEPKMKKELPDYKILGWESEEAQNLRFEVLLSAAGVSGRSLLDVGCGVGSLYSYIKNKGIEFSYTGVDILEKMIELAKEKNPSAEFSCVDIFNSNPFANRVFDIVYASGIFNLDLGNNRNFLAHALGCFNSLSREYIVFNLLHYKSPSKESGYFYFIPDEVPEIIASAGLQFESVNIMENYLSNDFTVFCRKSL